MLDFFDVNTIWFHIPLGINGYALSYIEAIGTLCGLLCIWLASLEKTINYLFGIINVLLFAVIFFQIHLYASLLLQLFFLGANVYGWYAWSRKNEKQQISLKIRWLSIKSTLLYSAISLVAICLLTRYIDVVFSWLAAITLHILTLCGFSLTLSKLPPDAYPLLDSIMTVLSITAMILMTRKYVENWILWVIVNIISVITYALQGVYVMAIEYVILLFIAINATRLWIKAAQQNNSSPSSLS